MKAVRLAGFLFTALLCLVLFSQPAFTQTAQVITCNSDDMGRHYCDVGPNTSIRLVRQRSEAQCIQGRTYGFDRNRIWVDRGCRADFEIIVPVAGGYGQGSYGQGGYGRGDGGVSATISCSSDDMRRHYCEIGPNQGVRVSRQRSEAQCIEGRTYGVRGTQLWVDHGCRADFDVLSYGGRGGRDHDGDHDRDHDRGDDHGGYNGGGTATTVYCASDNMRRNYCEVGPNRGVRLVRKRSDAACDLNRTYGVNGTQIWVDRGCRADFEVLQRR